MNDLIGIGLMTLKLHIDNSLMTKKKNTGCQQPSVQQLSVRRIHRICDKHPVVIIFTKQDI